MKTREVVKCVAKIESCLFLDSPKKHATSFACSVEQLQSFSMFSTLLTQGTLMNAFEKHKIFTVNEQISNEFDNVYWGSSHFKKYFATGTPTDKRVQRFQTQAAEFIFHVQLLFSRSKQRMLKGFHVNGMLQQREKVLKINNLIYRLL